MRINLFIIFTKFLIIKCLSFIQTGGRGIRSEKLGRRNGSNCSIPSHFKNCDTVVSAMRVRTCV